MGLSGGVVTLEVGKRRTNHWNMLEFAWNMLEFALQILKPDGGVWLCYIWNQFCKPMEKMWVVYGHRHTISHQHMDKKSRRINHQQTNMNKS